MSKIQQIWRPLGRIWRPTVLGEWGISHAAYPTVLPLSNGLVRIYFSTRDAKGRSNLASLDLALDGSRFEILQPPSVPLFTHGPRGAFDADGVTVTSFVRQKEGILAYYLGWTIGKSVPFTNTIGLAISVDGEQTFSRYSPAPIVGLSPQNPFSFGYPWVLKIQDKYRMWFGSHLAWGEGWMDMIHVIKSAQSHDGIHWTQEHETVVPLAGAAAPEEFAVSRPVVLQDEDGWSMWYARRYDQYRLGYAWSSDGVHWIRLDHLVQFVDRAENWEADARTYPCVFDHMGHRYMVYNGNGYGRDGFGIAMLVS